MRVCLHFLFAMLIIAAQCNKENGMLVMGRLWMKAPPSSGDNLTVDSESITYFLSKLSPGNGFNNNEWNDLLQQRQRMLDEIANNQILKEKIESLNNIRTKKRPSRIGESGGSLSIVNSLDVLRKRLLLEIARKKAKEEANRNRQILISFGKRGGYMMDNYPRVFPSY